MGLFLTHPKRDVFDGPKTVLKRSYDATYDATRLKWESLRANVTCAIGQKDTRTRNLSGIN